MWVGNLRYCHLTTYCIVLFVKFDRSLDRPPSLRQGKLVHTTNLVDVQGTVVMARWGLGYNLY